MLSMALCLIWASVSAQTELGESQLLTDTIDLSVLTDTQQASTSEPLTVATPAKQEAQPEKVSNPYRLRPFEHLDLGVTLGTTGIGIDAAMPVSEWLQLRTGFSFMPKFDYHMSFGVQVGDDASASASKFKRLSGMLEGFTGYKVDDHVDMIGQPTFWNFKLLADFFPFRNKHWHVTAGFYLGSSKIAKAFNTTEDMPSLMAVGIYNNLYEFYTKVDEEFGVPWYVTHSFMEGVLPDNVQFGDPVVNAEISERLQNYGRMGMHVGDFKSDGHAYMMEPDGDSMVKATIRVNSFKPYLGFGFSGRLLKNDDRYQIGFDCGALFWGGTPSIKTHDGTDLAKDVENIGGKVGTYVDFFKAFKVFPLLNLRITKRLF